MKKEDIEKLLSSKIKKSQIYLNSLTHRSASNKNNERLEFFGDAILGFFIAEYLYERFPDDDEGTLSRKRSYIVKKETLSKVAARYDIGSKIILGGGEKKSGGHRRDSIISDALEALIAVVYIVEGPDLTRIFIYKIFDDILNSMPSDENLKDPKTKLQEILQANNFELPNYETEEIQNKNNITFKTICTIKKFNVSESGSGSNKRKSQQEAALKAYNKIRKIYDNKDDE